MKMRSRFLLVFFITVIFTAVSKSQYYYGRNKVQYNPFEWHILKTEHFDVYYYPEMDSLAEIGAYYAEEAYSRLQNQLNHEIMRRIPLVFYSSHFHFRETNTLPYLIPQGLGGFFEFIKGRVVIPSDGSVPRFAHVIRHELVHVFERSVEFRLMQTHRSVRHAAIPLWFTEGLAEFWSDGWDEEAEMIIRDGVINQTLVPIQSLWTIQGTYLMYKEGQAILKYISETYGDFKIRQILENLWQADTFSEVLEKTLGTELKSLNEAWMYDLKKRVYPLMAEKDLPGMKSKRLTKEGFNTVPCFARINDSRCVIFVANRDGYTSIYRKNLDDPPESHPAMLIRGEKTPQMESLHLQRSRMDIDHRERLIFTAKSGPHDMLYIMDLQSSEIKGFGENRLVSILSPAWSPDGDRIVFSGIDPSGRQDLYLFRPASRETCRLTFDYYDDHDPDWSPDGKTLVFASNRCEAGESGFTNLFLMQIETGKIVQLTRGEFHDRQPDWSEDGVIAFSSDRDGTPNLWAVGSSDSDGTIADERFSGQKPLSPRQLTHWITGAYFPCWTDSATLLFTAFQNFGFQIHELTELQIPDTAAVAQSEPIRPFRSWSFPKIGGDRHLSSVRYRRKFSLDFAQSQVIQDPIYGTSGGGQIGMSDMLGNEQYYFLVYNNARTRSEFWDGFNLAVTRVDRTYRVNHAIGLYRLAGLYYNGYEGYFYERRYGGFGSVSYPLNAFERIESNLNIRRSEKDEFTGPGTRIATLVSNFFSYVHDNSLWGPTGPLDGSRYRITVGNTVDIQNANVNFTTLIVDLRHYFRLGLRLCHAVRIWGQFNQGKEPYPFAMGGSWDLRGYKLWSLWGPKLFLFSNEFRFPFIDHFYLGFPFGGVGFSAIRGALFMDAGNVWDGRFDDWKGSIGAGIRFRLGGYLVLRLDTGRRTDFKRLGQTFTQFFFGWDF
jgi:hypothetical protein